MMRRVKYQELCPEMNDVPETLNASAASHRRGDMRSCQQPLSQSWLWSQLRPLPKVRGRNRCRVHSSRSTPCRMPGAVPKRCSVSLGSGDLGRQIENLHRSPWIQSAFRLSALSCGDWGSNTRPCCSKPVALICQRSGKASRTVNFGFRREVCPVGSPTGSITASFLQSTPGFAARRLVASCGLEQHSLTGSRRCLRYVLSRDNATARRSGCAIVRPRARLYLHG